MKLICILDQKLMDLMIEFVVNPVMDSFRTVFLGPFRFSTLFVSRLFSTHGPLFLYFFSVTPSYTFS